MYSLSANQLMSHLVRQGFQNTLRGPVLRKMKNECHLAENNTNQGQDHKGLDMLADNGALA